MTRDKQADQFRVYLILVERFEILMLVHQDQMVLHCK